MEAIMILPYPLNLRSTSTCSAPSVTPKCPVQCVTNTEKPVNTYACIAPSNTLSSIKSTNDYLSTQYLLWETLMDIKTVKTRINDLIQHTLPDFALARLIACSNTLTVSEKRIERTPPDAIFSARECVPCSLNRSKPLQILPLISEEEEILPSISEQETVNVGEESITQKEDTDEWFDIPLHDDCYNSTPNSDIIKPQVVTHKPNSIYTLTSLDWCDSLDANDSVVIAN